MVVASLMGCELAIRSEAEPGVSNPEVAMENFLAKIVTCNYSTGIDRGFVVCNEELGIALGFTYYAEELYANFEFLVY